MPPTYEFYTDTYFGNQITEADFPRLTARASAYLDGLPCNLSDVSDDNVKMAICAVAEAWQINEQGGDVISQSVGPWSKTFQRKAKSDDDRLFDAAKIYLGGEVRRVGWV